MGFFRDIATPVAERGVPVVPLLPKQKQCVIPGWQTLATTDIAQICLWDQQHPDANCGSVAKAETGGVWFFEYDSPDVGQRVGNDTLQKLPDTFKVRSSPGRGHIYFRQSAESLAMGNIAQGFVKGGDWSARVHNSYVVSPGSISPRTGEPYEIRSLAPIIEAPSWFVQWCISQKITKEKAEEAPRDNSNLIPHGYLHDQLVSQCGRFISSGMPGGEALEEALLAWAHANCAPPLDEDHIRQIVRSTSSWKRGNPLADTLFHSGQPAGTTPDVAARPSAPPPTSHEISEAKPIIAAPYPAFPEWVMRGTSVLNGLVKPFCDVNSRYPEFMFLPAVTLMLNYLGNKVRVEMKDLTPSIFMVSVGRAGRVIKSSCVQDAVKYFEAMGCVGHGEQSHNNANGRALVFTVGSPEGFGKEMNRLNCRNGILFYDELKTLTDKASIDGSTLSSALLTLYESGKFQNVVKSPKDSFSLLPGSYCASLIACCTDKNFVLHWSKMAGRSSGLNDRFFFLLQPEKLVELTPYVHVDATAGAVETRKLIDKAIQKGVYSIADNLPFKIFLKENENSNRAAIRAEKFALYFAVDLDREEIDEECVERALALVDYELKVKKFLRVYEAATKEGGLQMEILSHLRMAGGVIQCRDLDRKMNATRYGTTLWSQAYTGLIKAGYMKEDGTGTKGDPKVLVALRLPEDDD